MKTRPAHRACGITMIAALAVAPTMALASSSLHRTWSDLWLTHDQQAQRALRDNDPAAAARLFTDPRHRAYAELRAGHYTDAAHALAPFADESSLYNRGNALARSGDLKGALTAYDAALKQVPGDSSARHNRALVAKALQQQARKPDSDSPAAGDGAQGGPAHATGGGAAAQPQSQSQSQPQPQSQLQPQAQSQSQSQSSASASASASASPLPSSPTRTRTGQRSAQAAAGHTAAQSTATDDAALAASAARAATTHKPPPTEQSLALEQWLRQIPDDPTELLRRKFLVEHWMRQQRGASP